LTSGSKGYLDGIANKITIMHELYDRGYLKKFDFNNKKTGLKDPIRRRQLTCNEKQFLCVVDNNAHALFSSRLKADGNEYHSTTNKRKKNNNSYTISYDSHGLIKYFLLRHFTINE
jgi:hypothetical protein